jgi:hypothetical protein
MTRKEKGIRDEADFKRENERTHREQEPTMVTFYAFII